MVRWILALLIVLGACIFATRHTPHHAPEGGTGDIFQALYAHVVPAPLVHVDEHAPVHAPDAKPAALLELSLPGWLGFIDWWPADERVSTVLFNLQVFQVAAVLLVVVCFSGVPGHLRNGRGDALTRMFAGFAQWVREEMILPVMGRPLGDRFAPYFLSIFFWILFMNLLGLLPHSGTATASIFVTGALALTTLLVMIGGGMVVQGPIAFWKNLVPHVPAVLWPLMFVVELMGLFVKPFALMVRLFANMTGGHMVVLSFMGLIFFFAGSWGALGGWGASPLGVGFAVFIMIIESFVALLQAFVFTQLSIMFVHASLHPVH
jgi:F-type H+-transporting ATPase subunit a